MALHVSHIIRRGKEMKKAIFPGSFDPLTLGHMDIIERASKLFDEVIVVVMINSAKQCMFSIEERLNILENALKNYGNVRCCMDNGLTIDYARKEKACAIIRGIRSVKDFEYERDIASLNHHLNADIETLIMIADPKFSYVSSSVIREMVTYGQDIHDFVNDEVCSLLTKKTL